MINEKLAKIYCKDNISQIENYDQAISDTTQVWHCHHRREMIYSQNELKEIGEYYNRPAAELIFLTKADHHRLHRLGKQVAEKTRKKISESRKGKPAWNKDKHLSEETRKKMSESRKGKHHSEETRKKMSESRKGKPSWIKGKHLSEETRKKIGEANIGTHWYNNGITNIQTETCPEGFVPGRLKR